MIDKLNQMNDVTIHSVYEDVFASFGRIVEGYDVSTLTSYMKEATSIPESGNVYVASVEKMEEADVVKRIQNEVYGGMPIQVGYCNGKNSTYNGFEYHKGSELNIAVTDFMLVLGHSYDIKNNSYDVSQATVFFVPKDTVIEMYQTTLHLSPLRVRKDGFKGVVILPRGTNTPLTDEEKNKRTQQNQENKLLLQRNKWVICHPDREPLVKQGAYAGVTGENKELKYVE